jgi:hypothetical protein
MITQDQWLIFQEKFNLLLAKDSDLAQAVKKIKKKMMMMIGVD